MDEDTDEKEKSPMVTLRTYFGYKPGGTLKDFMEEIRALPPEDKDALATGIKNGTFTY